MIYVSYSQKDRSVVQRVCRSLTEKGVQLFVDDKQLAGGYYAQELTKQIESAEAILFFYSENTENSTWVKHEIEFSILRKKTIIPVLLTRPEESDWLHFNLGSINWISIDKNNIEESTEKILSAFYAAHKRDEEITYTKNYGEEDILPNAKPTPLKCSNSYRSKAIGCGCLMIFILINTIIYFSYFSLSSPPESPHSRNTFPNKDSILIAENEITDEKEIPVSNKDTSNMISPQTNDENTEISSSKQPNIWLYLVLSFLAGAGLMFIVLRVKKSRKDNIKLSSDIASKISIDGDLQKEIESREVYSTHLEKGEYLIDFEDKQDENRHKTFNYEVTTKECKLVFANFLEESSQNGKSIKCFIAGSKTLQQERDALRAVTCVMYNKWDSKKFRILSYTFEDFKKEHTLVPPQELYNKFIEEEADWALFIIDGEIGGITVNEYRVAMDSFKRNGRPKILALAKVGSENNEKIAEIRDEINKEHQYWTDYTDIVSLKYIFESTLNWDLIRIFQDKLS